MTKRFGFTLAEVLITLGIIGVVAAMTIPTLISNTNGAQFKTAYKKALSTLNQAAVMNVALEDYDFSSLVAEPSSANGADANGGTSKTMSYILKNRLQSATNITDSYFNQKAADGTTTVYPSIHYYSKTTCSAEDIAAAATGDPCKDATAGDEVTVDTTVTVDGNWSVFAFADGTSFGYDGDAANCSTRNDSCVGFIDVNGATNPNNVIACTEGVEGGTGAASGTTSGACAVSASGITDVYPVFFYGQTVEPASDAARAVLFGK